MIQNQEYCPTPNATLGAVLGLLPTGPAWVAAREPGTNHNRFWTGVSTVVNFVESRLCDFKNELFCSTARESLDQWAEEYALVDDGCDPYGLNLCAKVNAQGGQSLSYMTNLALANGWAVALDDHVETGWQDTLCIAGEAVTGFASLGPVSEPYTNCVGGCSYGPASAYPEPELFDVAADRSAAGCAVPGFDLGQLEDCRIAGFFEQPSPLTQPTTNDTVCASLPTVFSYPVPSLVTAVAAPPSDTTGKFHRYVGYAHRIQVTIDVGASSNLMAQDPVFDADPLSLSAETIAGETYLNSFRLSPTLCFLEKIKPAHVALDYVLINN